MKDNKIYLYSTIVLSIIVLSLISYIVYDKFIYEEEKIVPTEKTKKVEDKNVIKELDITKCINGKDKVTYSNPTVDIELYGLHPKVNEDKLGVTINVDGAGVFNKNVNTIVKDNGDESDYLIYVNGFNKNIDKVYIGEFGQDATGLSLIYLFEDQTVGYTRLFKKNFDENNIIYFTLNYISQDNNNYIYTIDDYYKDINNIVGIYNADYNIPNGGGARTVIASVKDGSFYDLSKFMTF